QPAGLRPARSSRQPASGGCQGGAADRRRGQESRQGGWRSRHPARPARQHRHAADDHGLRRRRQDLVEQAERRGQDPLCRRDERWQCHRQPLRAGELRAPAMPEVLPNWHPVAVHFPIALALTATLLLLAGRLRPANPTLVTCARLLLALAAGAAVLAAALGWHAYLTVD